MKLAYVQLCGFRGYRDAFNLTFSDGFTVIDGRNGVGKSTIFDAVEFALTGKLSKYNEAKADGESVADYVWYTGDGPAPVERYVEIGFVKGDSLKSIRRTHIEAPSTAALHDLAADLVDLRTAPPSALEQVCVSSIIRDEHITGLSLDLKETERYARLREALGASDADHWIKRGAELGASAKKKFGSAELDVSNLNNELAQIARRLDEVRAGVLGDAAVAAAHTRLQEALGANYAADQIGAVVRLRMAEWEAEVESLEGISREWPEVQAVEKAVPVLRTAAERAETSRRDAAKTLEAVQAKLLGQPPSNSINAEASALISLVTAGRQLGLRDGHCPLCDHAQSREVFDNGIKLAEKAAMKLSETAASAAELENAREVAQRKLSEASQSAQVASAALATAEQRATNFVTRMSAAGLSSLPSNELLRSQISALRTRLELAKQDLRVIDTLRLHSDLERTQQQEGEIKQRLAKAQERLGRARKAEAIAHSLHDAARRAASETLDFRLERVLPLMAELYRRLKPHPVWQDIEYSIRGDVKRFMKLQVGDELNPQFLFSSGQRRATGLAFLLSVNLSLAWSRWQSVLLDDPVQHVDDFRTIHLAEVMAQLVSSGKQVICSVEDAALADLLCRRLPVTSSMGGKRVTLGANREGVLGILEERVLPPLLSSALALNEIKKAAG